ncbi:hypothetical protein [Nocardia sp. bgisy134]|uniref:hypothetical protein n=1 Tax=Nocardia sp. bgisy134 TaxID=3413789 RepID=UPI003D71E563
MTDVVDAVLGAEHAAAALGILLLDEYFDVDGAQVFLPALAMVAATLAPGR